jgi:hypothetical protein
VQSRLHNPVRFLSGGVQWSFLHSSLCASAQLPPRTRQKPFVVSNGMTALVLEVVSTGTPVTFVVSAVLFPSTNRHRHAVLWLGGIQPAG